MAEVLGKVEMLGQGVIRVTWADMAGNDTGEPVKTAAFADRTVQAIGDGTSVSILGSNDGTNGIELADAGGTEIDLNPATFELAMIRENPLYIWPAVTGGASTDVILIATTER
jgi:hypothetical protein